jgi:peptide/nickel transport system substrate-binding protein
VVQALINGDIDFYENAPVAQIDAVKNVAGLHVESSASPLYDYISFNFLPDNWPDKFVPFASVKTRQAISYAINRKGMVDSVLKGYGTLLNGPFLPGFWAYTDGASFDYPFDQAKAKALLAEDGWKAGSDGILVKDGHRFEFEVLYRADNQRRQNFAQIIQQNLADVGIKMNLKPLEFSALIDEHVDPGKYEAYLGGWQLGLDPDIESILGSGFFPPGGQNSGFYKNETVDKLAAQGYRTNDKTQRRAIYAQVAKALSDDPPYVFLCQTNYNTIYNSRVHWAEADKPIQSLPYGYIFHVFNWWVTK